VIEIKAPVEAFEDADEGVEGLLEAWLVSEGDDVTVGQAVADAVVVKTSFQVCAPCDGTIGEIVVPKGDTFGVGAVLARMEESAGVGPGATKTASLEQELGAPGDAGLTRVPITGMRGAVAREMTSAWQHPRVAVGVEVEMTAALAALDAQRTDGARLSPTLAVIRAAALSLVEHPRLNALVSKEAVDVATSVNIGLAVSLEEGVIVPVIRDADRKSMAELAAETAELARVARAGELPGTALRDGTFTVSTLGASGIDWFTPVLNSPQAAILGVGRVAERPVVRDQAVIVAPTVVLTLVFDHRAVDGHPAALFLAAVRNRLERGQL
jgi:pyruvate/2-oxoglutarate dehydrogenase complex dihydrolipoamide acyltransferase (E2) component